MGISTILKDYINMQKSELINVILALIERETYLRNKFRLCTNDIDTKYFKMQLDCTINLINRFRNEYRS